MNVNPTLKDASAFCIMPSGREMSSADWQSAVSPTGSRPSSQSRITSMRGPEGIRAPGWLRYG